MKGNLVNILKPIYGLHELFLLGGANLLIWIVWKNGNINIINFEIFIVTLRKVIFSF